MRIIRSFLVAVITLSLVAGYGSVQMKKTVSAATADKKFTVKAASDFTLKLPENWKGNYVMKTIGKKKQGSGVAFSAKKCYEKNKEGWLFSIMRYKDNSYEDLPSYELVGKWGGISYIAVYPTDVQVEGATKAARKQYTKLNKASEKTANSIRPAKVLKKKKGYFCATDFAIKLPSNWKGNYVAKKSKKKSKSSYVTFYAKKCYKYDKQGWLFSIERYKDDSYQDLPSYELVAKWGGYSYVAVYPTDVQYERAPKAAQKQYTKMYKNVEKTVKTIRAIK